MLQIAAVRGKTEWFTAVEDTNTFAPHVVLGKNVFKKFEYIFAPGKVS